MDLTDVWDMFEYWQEEPPSHLLQAGRYGYKAPSRVNKPTQVEQNFEAQSGPARPFDCLPLAIQQMILESRNG